MYRILIWGSGAEYSRHINSVKYLELLNQLSIIGITSNDPDIINCLDGIPFFKKEDISCLSYDYIFVALENPFVITEEATKYGIDINILIPIKIASIPNIDFNDYINLKNSNISIFSSNCWAGICYHTLGLPFMSPTINMFESENDFIKLMKNLKHYLAQPVQYCKNGYDDVSGLDYPIGIIDDVLLYFNHYNNFDDAANMWQTRAARVNYNNIAVVAFTESEETVYDFESIPYSNKIIFTPLDISSPSSIKISKDNQGRLWAPVCATASSAKNLIDVISFLNGKNDFAR